MEEALDLSSDRILNYNNATVVNNTSTMLLFGVSCQLFVLTIHIIACNKMFTFQYSISLIVIAFLFVRAVLTFF